MTSPAEGLDAGPALSVLDLVPVRSDQTSGDALAATVSLARTADELGYRRYWLAEHHNMPAVAATNPPVLIAMVAGATHRIRVGSGGVMLPNHAPLVVAEQFALLEAAYPGRIDLGIGRAPGTDPVTSWALRHGAGGVSDEAVEQLPAVRRRRPGDDGHRRGRGRGRRAPPPAARDPAGDRSWPTCGCSAPPTTRPGSRPRRACPTCSPTTSPGRGPPRRWSSTARSSGPRRRWRSRAPSSPSTSSRPRRREQADRLALPQLLSMLALRTGQPLHPQQLVEEAEKAELPAPHRELLDAMRAPLGDRRRRRGPGPGRRPGRRARRRRGDGPPRRRRPHGHRSRCGPGARGDAAPAGGVTSRIRVSLALPPTLACRPNVGRVPWCLAAARTTRRSPDPRDPRVRPGN